MSSVTNTTRAVASTGIAGLDDILAGGFTRSRLFLIEGVPGIGEDIPGAPVPDGCGS
jgi:circadian clock protein KaiC